MTNFAAGAEAAYNPDSPFFPFGQNPRGGAAGTPGNPVRKMEAGGKAEADQWSQQTYDYASPKSDPMGTPYGDGTGGPGTPYFLQDQGGGGGGGGGGQADWQSYGQYGPGTTQSFQVHTFLATVCEQISLY